VSACVDPSGHLSGAPSVLESSGFARLDAAALKLAQAGSGRYRPTVEDGHPVASCYPFRITFSLKR
jgi:TonB family protein